MTCDGRVDGVLLESTPDLRQACASPPPSAGDALVLRSHLLFSQAKKKSAPKKKAAAGGAKAKGGAPPIGLVATAIGAVLLHQKFYKVAASSTTFLHAQR